jgi:hypothetical protein
MRKAHSGGPVLSSLGGNRGIRIFARHRSTKNRKGLRQGTAGRQSHKSGQWNPKGISGSMWCRLQQSCWRCASPLLHQRCYEIHHRSIRGRTLDSGRSDYRSTRCSGSVSENAGGVAQCASCRCSDYRGGKPADDAGSRSRSGRNQIRGPGGRVRARRDNRAYKEGAKEF